MVHEALHHVVLQSLLACASMRGNCARSVVLQSLLVGGTAHWGLRAVLLNLRAPDSCEMNL